MPSAKSAIIVFGKNAGRTLTVCLDDECPVHTNHAPHEAVVPPPVMVPAPEQETETEEEAAQREVEHEQRMRLHCCPTNTVCILSPLESELRWQC
jgi:ParB family chromosome partitioning protein